MDILPSRPRHPAFKTVTSGAMRDAVPMYGLDTQQAQRKEQASEMPTLRILHACEVRTSHKAVEVKVAQMQAQVDA